MTVHSIHSPENGQPKRYIGTIAVELTRYITGQIRPVGREFWRRGMDGAVQAGAVFPAGREMEGPSSAALSLRRLRPAGGPLEETRAKSAAIPRTSFQNPIPMIRISFDTRTNSEDAVDPDAWRIEASAMLRDIAQRIAAGEAMPLILRNRDGIIIGKARELSYQPEPARQSAVKPPFG